MENKDEVANAICADLNRLDSIEGEYFYSVNLNIDPHEQDDWREQSGALRARSTSIPESVLTRIWGGKNHFRVFLSHKSTIKIDTFRLKTSLAKLGLTAFVAHEDINPSEEWAREIERALFSMDALVALLTDNFHDSDWTDQEVGFALGRGTPVMAASLGLLPYGLMGKLQALKCKTLNDTDLMASEIFEVLLKKVSNEQRLFEGALERYSGSESWEQSAWNVDNLLSKFEKLERQQVDQIIKEYKMNSKNRDSFKGNKLLHTLLTKWTGERWPMKGGIIVFPEEKTSTFDDVPF